MIDGPGQHALTVQALELLGRSHDAHERGDVGEAVEIIKPADPETVILILGGITIGEIPAPGTPEFWAYVDHVRANPPVSLETETGV